MSDIVEKLKTTDPWESPQEAIRVMGEAAKDIERLRAALELYRDAVRVDVTMEGPKFMGSNASALKRAWDADCAALTATPAPKKEDE